MEPVETRRLQVLFRNRAVGLSIRSLGNGTGLAPGKIDSIRLLGSTGTVTWSRDDSALTVLLPDPGRGKHAYVLEILGLIHP